MERMSGLDASFLYVESPTQLMTIGVVALVDPGSFDRAEGGYSFERMRDRLAERVAEIPVLLRKPRPVPLGLDHPLWVVDEDFDLDRHVHRLAVPSPAGLEEVSDIVGHMSGIPMPHDRPLWEMWFIEGMADGRVAIFAKLHHSMVDGVASADVIGQLCGLAPTDEQAAREARAERQPTAAELLGRGLLKSLARPVGIVRLLPHTVTGISRTVRRAASGTTMAAPFRAPRLPFNGAVTGHRTVALADLSLEEMKEVRALTGATVNDVLLTVCGGALRRYLAERDLLPEQTLVANIPVSVRATSERATGSNKVSILFVRLGSHVEDHLERLMTVHKDTRSAKEHSTALGPDTLHDWAEVGSSPLVGVVMRSYSNLRLADRHRVVHNLTISNIPGPPGPLTFLGGRLDAVYPLGPVMDGAGLNLTAMSLDGTLHVGLHGCREQIPDVWSLAGHVGPVMAELLAQVRSRA
ncbi:WS/DGAT/MGAT family O-acyltransferase [Nocardioides marmoribigeumensis]|uniref:Diacylglycerol O-acyltransferase n=1 Tax=Nocardioides marmoribigeumensis TaxID=433649 RepID=A0ABU2BYT6_9ACTN|nr:wax ester/triacylglycerol synthase family O-acyltransferase [Nocardioides marmoribigeumensis]MDR7363537.1 diacylglycerol O-acyltransferase [Nocardioides marmoribigeumensis]